MISVPSVIILVEISLLIFEFYFKSSPILPIWLTGAISVFKYYNKYWFHEFRFVCRDYITSHTPICYLLISVVVSTLFSWIIWMTTSCGISLSRMGKFNLSSWEKDKKMIFYYYVWKQIILNLSELVYWPKHKTRDTFTCK